MKNQNINTNQEYKYGFTTDIENIRAPKGLNESSIKFISKIKKEPKWMLDWRLKAFDRLKKLNGIAVDAVFDSVSVATTFKDKLTEKGIIFCSISEAIQKHPELVKKYLGSVIPLTDHYFATLNSAVFTDGSFVYIPKGIKCPMELSTYFRINASQTGQFERTLIIADEESYVSYL